ncbi:hypothetical protein [Streptomyces sp.]|uniref:hypothetical protein n=1 Tax=Streptomyces sp. TaxID=1931 RepID=UPI002D652AF4|nr:hypothetical protein [Streptomyces sp.]HZF92148.1 hypothetical protein [Streptomyces sp.]
MTPASGGGQVRNLDTLIRLGRGLSTPGTPAAPGRLSVPDGMSAPLGCDAVGMPARFGPQVVPRLPRVGCVYAGDAHWWWLVPSDSDYALEWPAPARYVIGAVVPDAPRLIRRPDGELPYTPPIPLYLTLCRLTGTTPSWSQVVSA